MEDGGWPQHGGGSDGEDDEEEGDICPLCCNDLDATDKHFRPCKCGYQICAWCWHQRACPECTPHDEYNKYHTAHSSSLTLQHGSPTPHLGASRFPL